MLPHRLYRSTGVEGFKVPPWSKNDKNHLWEDVIVAPLLFGNLHHSLGVLATPALCHNQDGQDEDNEDGHEEDNEDGAEDEGNGGEDDGNGKKEKPDQRPAHRATVTLAPTTTSDQVERQVDIQIPHVFSPKKNLNILNIGPGT